MSQEEKQKYSDFSEDLLRKLWSFFIVVLVCTLVAEFFMHPHPYFGIDGTLFFHAWYGFAACAAIVAVSLLLGKVLKRKERYYDGDS